MRTSPRRQSLRPWIGTSYRGGEIEDALAIAAGRRDWIARFGPLLLALLLLTALLSAVDLVTLWTAAAKPPLLKAAALPPHSKKSPSTPS